jgi:hypothetical protein
MPLPAQNLNHICFQQPTNPDIRVWRYVDLSKLLFLLLRRELTLVRLDTLPDKFEGLHGRNFETAFREAMYRGLKDAQDYQGNPESVSADLTRRAVNFQGSVRKAAYVSCWRYGPNESEAMWRIYGAGQASAALVLPYSTLRDSLNEESLFIGQVRYFDFNRDVLPGGNIYWPLVFKRHEYEHEHEVRIVKVDPSFLTSNPEVSNEASAHPSIPSTVSISWDASKHVERIVVSPYCSAWELAVIKETVGRISPTLEERVVDSEMSTR